MDHSREGRGILFILGSPCDAAGHRLRTRAECDTSKIAYFRRFAEPGHVYIAALKTARMLKVGSCKDIVQREKNLCAQCTGRDRLADHRMGEVSKGR